MYTIDIPDCGIARALLEEGETKSGSPAYCQTYGTLEEAEQAAPKKWVIGVASMIYGEKNMEGGPLYRIKFVKVKE